MTNRFSTDATKKFFAWLESWWRDRHPDGGGEPPTLQEAFMAGAKMLPPDVQRNLLREEDR